MGDGVDLTMLKDSQCVAEDEINVPLDVAILKILPGGNTRSIFRLAGTSGSIERVLRAQKTHITEDRPVTVDRESEGL